MFAQATVYTFTNLPATAEIPELIKPQEYVPIGASQEKSVGFVPPRNENHGALVESLAGHTILSLVIETKSVPGHIIRKMTDEKVVEIENSTGRKPGKKERRDIADEVQLTMLPTAFPKQTRINIWLDVKAGLLVVGSTTQSKIDEVITALVNAFPSFAVAPLQTTHSPRAMMSTWLLATTADDWPQNISIERECTLKASDESSATVKFSNHHLATDEVKKHIAEGKLPTQLALSWDGKVAFVFTELAQLKKIKYLDGVMDESGTDKSEDRFDADMALSTGLLAPLIQDLIEALGGKMPLAQDQAQEQVSHP